MFYVLYIAFRGLICSLITVLDTTAATPHNYYCGAIVRLLNSRSANLMISRHILMNYVYPTDRIVQTYS